MSSIISHIYMADKLKDRYKLKNEFLYGAILPDMLASTEVYNKKETHYLKKFEINGNIGDYPDSKHIYDDYPIMDRYLLKDRNINMETLKKEFLMLSANNTITSNINKNFKLFDLRCSEYNLLTNNLINEYIEEALSKVILILDEILYKK